jgi:cation diffusion facilitator CzcD-associated flavoprotein CzcO
MEKVNTTDYDVIVIGAGISGINAAYRLQTQAPGFSFTILEARDGMGGTWDFFKYPGIRSDSDLWTFGFPWAPWTEQRAIADGASIKAYIEHTAKTHHIDEKIQYHHKVIASDWSSDQQQWRLDVDVRGEQKQFHAKFVLFASGYYDYAKPLQTTINGIENFNGTVVHPQYWPSDLDYANKDTVIIGSGATAITLLPNLAEKASHVTMLQRSPGYILSLPNRGDDFVTAYLPQWLSYRINRLKALILPWLFYLYCTNFPASARKVVKKATLPRLPKGMEYVEPTYNPWEQRMCFSPDGDFYDALNSGKAEMVTGKIATMTADSIVLESGQKIHADIICTATGLKLQLAGGTNITVDGEKYSIPDKFMWKGVMLQDLPNAALVIGYTNASWTLGADATAQMVCRLLNNMRKQGNTSFVPRVPVEDKMKEAPVLNLNSTYVTKGKSELPKAGDKGQWKPRWTYFQDIYEARFGDVTTGLQFYRVAT